MLERQDSRGLPLLPWHVAEILEREGRVHLLVGVTLTVHKIIVSNDLDDELSSARNMIASTH
jgi:hypothetical protein